MIKKSFRGRPYGAKMTVSEKKAMEKEIHRQLAEYDRLHAQELDALILWVLHNEFGFGEKRLKKFYDCFARSIEELVDHYSMDYDKDKFWLCTYKLKQAGIDLEKWCREGEKNMAEELRADSYEHTESRLLE